MGRLTILTASCQAEICKYVRAGAPLPQACEAAGISWNTAKEWLRRGKAKERPYAAFVAACRQAKARWAVAQTISITKAAPKDWKAGAWLLERRIRAFRPPRFEVTGKHGGPVQMTHDVTRMTDAQLLEILGKGSAEDADDGDDELE